MSLPTDSKVRKQIPLYRGGVLYFPDALAAVAQCSFLCNEQHSPGQPMRWAKEKSFDEQDALMRHMFDAADEDTDDRDKEGVLHATKEAWRALANLQRLSDSGVDIYAPYKPQPDESGPFGTQYKNYCAENIPLYRPIGKRV